MKKPLIFLIFIFLTGCISLKPNSTTSNTAMNWREQQLEPWLQTNDSHVEVEEAVEKTTRDDIIGLPKQRVAVKFGFPDHVEIAGNPKYENERWVYQRSIPTEEGSYPQTQVIYFESGHVVGWESR